MRSTWELVCFLCCITPPLVQRYKQLRRLQAVAGSLRLPVTGTAITRGAVHVTGKRGELAIACTCLSCLYLCVHPGCIVACIYAKHPEALPVLQCLGQGVIGCCCLRMQHMALVVFAGRQQGVWSSCASRLLQCQLAMQHSKACRGAHRGMSIILLLAAAVPALWLPYRHYRDNVMLTIIARTCL